MPRSIRKSFWARTHHTWSSPSCTAATNTPSICFCVQVCISVSMFVSVSMEVSFMQNSNTRPIDMFLCAGVYVCVDVCVYVCVDVCVCVGGTLLRARQQQTPRQFVSVRRCLSVCLSVCPSVCLSICLSVCLSVYLSVCLSVCLSVRPSVCPSIYLSICLYVCRSVCLSLCLSVYLSVYLSVCLSICNFLLGAQQQQTPHHCVSVRRCMCVAVCEYELTPHHCVSIRRCTCVCVRVCASMCFSCMHTSNKRITMLPLCVAAPEASWRRAFDPYNTL